MNVKQIRRSAGQSPVAAAAYRAAERLHDARQDITHDYTRKGGVVHKEILVPDNAPGWARKLSRESLWNMVDARERRKDAQVAREIRIMLPRELDPATRISLARAFVKREFVDRGMIADLAIHCPKAADGKDQPHAHVLLTMRELTEEGFGQKSRHDWVPDPTGRTHPDGRPVMVESNAQSWNSAAFYGRIREAWEHTANDALARAGSDQRIDRRSYLERGLSRLPEPYLGLAIHLKELHGIMRERFGQFQVARHYRAVEERAKAALAKLGQGQVSVAETMRTARRYFDWIERQADALAPARDGPEPASPGSPTPEWER
ncbi:MobQ family relaxase [Sphingomonas sp. AOB5]|uniref:MobQ family relaxase n=1 Tax=Sphingomonas sp. AOB5 TaxID=3034017 RepID=UPI0023F99AB7|nr:MobQ family relaxase [Sphingomonas sp. AOB5]MDF7776038.1 MobQ family relaxase [Sphingomonas sp. AOB5]